MTQRNSNPPFLILVDDDPAVLTSLSFVMEIEGYSVTGFASAEDLLRSGLDFRGCCVIADQMLPGMSGVDLLELLRAKDPHQKAILTVSALTPTLQRRADRSGLRVIEKPVLGNVLIDAIQSL